MEVTVSVIMPTYNCGRYIKESIDSVRSQTMKDWELIIVDDCSTDDTEDVVSFYCFDRRIRYYKLLENSGPAKARNAALDVARGKYIAFLDSDDLWLPEKLEKQIAFMRQTGAKLSCTAYEKMHESGGLTGVVVMPYEKADYNKVLFAGNSLGNSTVMYERSCFSELRVPLIKKRNDFALWLQILKQEQYAYGLREPLMQYRVRQSSVSSNKKSLIKYQWELYRDIEELSIFKASAALTSCIMLKTVKMLKERSHNTQIETAERTGVTLS